MSANDQDDVVVTGFALLFDQALSDRDMPLSSMRAALDARGLRVSLATLSYWRSGARTPDSSRSMPMIAEMERILGVRPGMFTRQLAARSRRVGSIARLSEEREERDDAQLEMFAMLDASPSANMRMLSAQETISISEHGGVSGVSSTVMFQCVQGHIDSFAFIHRSPEPTDAAPVMLDVVGGSVVSEIAHEDRRTFGTKIALDRALGVGETGMLSFDGAIPPEHPILREHEFSVRRPVREVIQRFVLPARNPPEWFEETERVAGRVRRVPVFPQTDDTAHRIRSNFGPGAIRMRWGGSDDW